MAMKLEQLKVGEKYDFGRYLAMGAAGGRIVFKDGTELPNGDLGNHNILLTYRGKKGKLLLFDVSFVNAEEAARMMVRIKLDVDVPLTEVSSFEVEASHALERLHVASEPLED